MSIQTISSIANTYCVGASSRTSAAAATVSSAVDGTGDSATTVTISSAARQALGAEHIPTVSEEAAQEGIPEGLVLLQVPSWFGDLMFQVDPDDPKFAQMYPQAAAAPRSVIDKFESKFFEHIARNGTANGLTGASLEEFHQRMIADKQSSEKIREQFVAGIRQDREMMSVMKQLGVTGMLDASDARAAAAGWRVGA
ncbi:MAG: hypothetical protein EG824_00285 [Deltaproteobacteria bacterium]|nr:hypothetical protein [Deltaproteobacteria bacterium]